jgi:hypothetical protein
MACAVVEKIGAAAQQDRPSVTARRKGKVPAS